MQRHVCCVIMQQTSLASLCLARKCVCMQCEHESIYHAENFWTHDLWSVPGHPGLVNILQAFTNDWIDDNLSFTEWNPCLDDHELQALPCLWCGGLIWFGGPTASWIRTTSQHKKVYTHRPCKPFDSGLYKGLSCDHDAEARGSGVCRDRNLPVIVT